MSTRSYYYIERERQFLRQNAFADWFVTAFTYSLVLMYARTDLCYATRCTATYHAPPTKIQKEKYISIEYSKGRTYMPSPTARSMFRNMSPTTTKTICRNVSTFFRNGLKFYPFLQMVLGYCSNWPASKSIFVGAGYPLTRA